MRRRLQFVHLKGVDGAYRPLVGNDSRPTRGEGVVTVTCALGPDCAGTLVTRFLEQTTDSLDCAVYEVGPSYRWAFARASVRGVPIRLLLDGHRSDGNTATARAVKAAGGACRVLPRAAGEGHWKFLVAGAERVAIGTGNLIWRDAPRDAHGRLPPDGPGLAGTREWWIFLAGAPRTAATIRMHFERAWSASVAPPRRWTSERELRVSGVGVPRPRRAPFSIDIDERHLEVAVGGAAVAELLTRHIEAARRRAFAIVPYVRPGESAAGALLEAIRRARGRGAAARLLLGLPPDARDADRLAHAGLDLRAMDPRRCTTGHAKGLVVDDTVVVSSANWSSSGLGANREAAVAITDHRAAGYYAAALDSDWQLSAPLLRSRRDAVSPPSDKGIM